MELLLGIALKAISNYLDHVSLLPLITPLRARASNLSGFERNEP